MGKVYVVVGDSGLNGSWAEAAFRNPPTGTELDDLEYGANNTWPKNKDPNRRCLPTGWSGYEVFELEIREATP